MRLSAVDRVLLPAEWWEQLCLTEKHVRQCDGAGELAHALVVVVVVAAAGGGHECILRKVKCLRFFAETEAEEAAAATQYSRK